MAMILNENEYIRHLEKNLHIAEDDSLDSWDPLAFRWVNFKFRFSCCVKAYAMIFTETIDIYLPNDESCLTQKIVI